MNAAALVNRLEFVRETGPDRWIARCPAHEDRSPSLSIRELADGRLLLHCFAGCGAADVLAVLGLTLADLYPEPLPRAEGYTSRGRIHPADALRCIAHESSLAAIVASDIAEGRAITPEDADRAALAAGRIRAAMDAARCAA